MRARCSHPAHYIITHEENSVKQVRTTQGRETRRCAHAFLVGRDLPVSMGDLQTHIDHLATR